MVTRGAKFYTHDDNIAHSAVTGHVCQIWPLIGPDQLQMGQIRDFLGSYFSQIWLTAYKMYLLI